MDRNPGLEQTETARKARARIRDTALAKLAATEARKHNPITQRQRDETAALQPDEDYAEH